jgi:hypothetical protein
VKNRAVMLALAAVFLLASSALTLAMSSANYQLEWFTPATSGGGGPASSANYAVNLTIGQAAIGSSASTGYWSCLGYWCGVAAPYWVYLPLVLKGY